MLRGFAVMFIISGSLSLFVGLFVLFLSKAFAIFFFGCTVLLYFFAAYLEHMHHKAEQELAEELNSDFD